MYKLSRTFYAIEYTADAGPTNLSDEEKYGSKSAIVHIDKSKNRLHLIDHEYPEHDVGYDHRTMQFDMILTDWGHVSKLSDMLKRYKDLPDDVSLKCEIDVDKLEMQDETWTREDDLENDHSSYTYGDVTISVDVRPSLIGFAVVPEPDEPIFPTIPTGDAYSLDGDWGANEVNLNRFIELLDEICREVTQTKDIDATVPQEYHSILNNTKYGHEVIKHAQDGDICLEKDMLHLALSSYIHAIEWTTITYLNDNDIDIIEEEQNGNFYYFAGGENSIVDELREHGDIDQKTISQLESMNRAERRWMAHHKSGRILPEEVDAIRARLSSLLKGLFARED